MSAILSRPQCVNLKKKIIGVSFLPTATGTAPVLCANVAQNAQRESARSPIIWVGGDGGFSKAVAAFNHVGGSFNLFVATARDVWIIPSFGIWHYVLYVSHPFSSLSSSLGFAGGNRCQKITIPIFRLVLRNFALPCYFPYIIFCRYFFLTFFRLVCHCSLWLFFSKELAKCLESL